MGRHSTVQQTDRVHVLLVCTANLCRSPLAEHLARAGLGAHDDVVVSSAGVAATEGTGMDPAAAAELRERGLDPSAFRTRRLTAELVGAADLVLVASRRQRAVVAELDPQAVVRTFTVPELARHARALQPADLPSASAAERLLALVDIAGARRGTVPPVRPTDDDVADPYRRGAAAMQECASLLARHTAAWTELVMAPAYG